MTKKINDHLSVAFKKGATDQKKQKSLPLFDDPEYLRDLKLKFIEKHNKKFRK